MKLPSRRRLVNRARAALVGAGASAASFVPARSAGVDPRIVPEVWDAVAGQTCVCTNRIYVQRGIAAPFVAKMADAVSALMVVKQSGFGREGGHWGLDEYLYVKYVSLGVQGQ